jgi:hypothetical protein
VGGRCDLLRLGAKGRDDVLGFVTGAALAALAAKKRRHGKRSCDQLNLLTPFNSHTFLDTGVAVSASRTLGQEIPNFFRNTSV